MRKHYSRKDGFTLLELSIVLVIIGLLIGGIFVGQSLIHTAQINAAISEFNRYQTAVQNFRQQYQALPGDMTNATSFWGIAAGTAGNDATCAAAVSTTAATCDGNGNGQIYNVTVGELWRFWQHLANAKMIEGSYPGYSATGATRGIIPDSKFPGAIWGVWPTNVGGPGAPWFNVDYGTGHTLILGGSTTDGWPDNPIMTPKDAWSIDKKFDDGKPASGNVIAGWYQTCANATSITDTTATYTVATATKTCMLFFVSGF